LSYSVLKKGVFNKVRNFSIS